jgi:hypothetical protein
MRVNLSEDPEVFGQHFNHQGSLGKRLGQGKGGDFFLGLQAAFWPLQGRSSFGICLPPSSPFCLSYH